MEIRSVKINDASQLVELFLALDGETSFMLYEPGERSISVDQQRERTKAFIDSVNQVMFVAENTDSQIVGFVVGIGGSVNRNRHSLYCVIGIRAPFTGKGIGKSLMNSLLAWATRNSFTRIELTVMEHNENAIGLYKSCGFEIEGTKRNSLLVDGEYLNELYMSKLLTA